MYYLYKKKDNLIVWKDDMHGLLEMHSILVGDISIAWKICRVSKDQIRQDNWKLIHESNFMHRIVEKASLEAL